MLTVKLNRDAVYLTEVIKHKAVNCTTHPEQFVIQGCDNHGLLKRNEYHFIDQTFMTFLDGEHALYCCSCNKARKDKQLGLTQPVQETYSACQSPMCIHVKCIQKYWNSHAAKPCEESNLLVVPDHSYSCTGNDSTNVFCVGCRDKLGVMSPDIGPGVVVIFKHKLKCATCATVACCHITAVDNMFENIQSVDSIVTSEILATMKELCNLNTGHPVELSSTSAGQGVLRCFSKQPIEYNGNVNYISNNEVFPENHPCYTCGAPSTARETISMQPKPLISLSQIQNVTVALQQCRNCGCAIEYDGRGDSVVHLSKCVVAHALLRHFFHLFVNTGCPIFGMYETICDDLGGELISIFPYYYMTSAWYNYIQLLKLPHMEFECKICKGNPDIIIIDGTSIGMRKDLAPVISVSQEIPRNSTVTEAIRYNQFIYIDSRVGRKLIQLLAKEGLNSENYGELHKYLASANTTLLDFLADIVHVDNALYTVPLSWIKFVWSLGSASPITALIDGDTKLFDLFTDISNGVDITQYNSKVGLLAEKLPCVLGVIKNRLAVPHTFGKLLLHIAVFINAAYSKVTDRMLPHDHSKSDLSDTHGLHTFFPSMSVHRTRLKYSLDTTVSKGICNKVSTAHKYLTPGVVIIFCQHGIAYGYQVMKNVESPNIVFTLLFERFQQMPRVIIYDNACHLHQYMIRREPIMVRNTRFFVDRLHWKNHTGCSVGYNLYSYDEQLIKINSQAAEQCNSTLKKIRRSLSYMTLPHFTKHLTLFLWKYNIKKLKQQQCNKT